MELLHSGEILRDMNLQFAVVGNVAKEKEDLVILKFYFYRNSTW